MTWHVYNDTCAMVSYSCATTESKVDCRFPASGSGSFDRFERLEGSGTNWQKLEVLWWYKILPLAKKGHYGA